MVKCVSLASISYPQMTTRCSLYFTCCVFSVSRVVFPTSCQQQLTRVVNDAYFYKANQVKVYANWVACYDTLHPSAFTQQQTDWFFPLESLLVFSVCLLRLRLRKTSGTSRPHCVLPYAGDRSSSQSTWVWWGVVVSQKITKPLHSKLKVS